MENQSFDRAAIAATLEHLVASSMAKRLRGPVLAAQLRMLYPAFDFRRDSLLPMSSFISAFVPKLKRDVSNDEYYLESSPTIQQLSKEPTAETRKFIPPQIWFAFSSSQEKEKVVLDTFSRELRVVPRTEPTSASSVEIKSLTTEDHRSIARNFANERGMVQMGHLIDSPSPTWYKELFAVLDIQTREHWRAYHNAKVLEMLAKRVNEAGVDFGACGMPWMRPAQSPAGARQVNKSTFETQTLRIIARRLVNQLPEEELSKLRFELGAVLRAIQGSEPTVGLS